jgi:hypothetical protein
MAKHQAVLGALLALFLLGVTPAMAQGPTATPTPHPMPTGQYGDLRTVPTPWVMPAATPLAIGADVKAGELADTIINGYKWINFKPSEEAPGIIDVLLFMIFVFFALSALWGVIVSFRQASEEED